MTISNAVVGNLTTIYLVVIATMKAYGLAVGRSFGSAYVLALSTAVVAAVLVASLAWDVSRKVTQALMARDSHHEMCRGGICWHGVAVKSPASEVRFRLPHHHHLR
ncbi:hypothetical protein SASPL_103606 [Salvia splendens]|uniref:Uncharacterized protein n=1 Tax=Salvia splendens TaxID=180675 RepID=A0A8X8YLY7_SALSN|nr:uncharacterized protein LOC121793117 [Salvia splendens]KAG6432033.1 hypothetical protein SASPL_103606 [Salvia splendens]